MSHPSNDEYLEYAKNEFESAETSEEREAIVQRLRDDGFSAQAMYLAPFVEEGMPLNADELHGGEDREELKDK